MEQQTLSMPESGSHLAMAKHRSANMAAKPAVKHGLTVIAERCVRQGRSRVKYFIFYDSKRLGADLFQLR